MKVIFTWALKELIFIQLVSFLREEGIDLKVASGQSVQKLRCSAWKLWFGMEILTGFWISSALGDFRFNNNWRKFKWSILCRQPSLNNLLLSPGDVCDFVPAFLPLQTIWTQARMFLTFNINESDWLVIHFTWHVHFQQFRKEMQRLWGTETLRITRPNDQGLKLGKLQLLNLFTVLFFLFLFIYLFISS